MESFHFDILLNLKVWPDLLVGRLLVFQILLFAVLHIDDLQQKADGAGGHGLTDVSPISEEL